MIFNIILFAIVGFLASVAGSICGIGGGVIIKPVLDATRIMSVSAISFLSGCTVLSMSVISVVKAIRSKTTNLNVKIATPLAIGAAVGGVTGKSVFEFCKSYIGNETLVGFIQAVVLIIITVGTLIYTVYKSKIKTKKFTNLIVCLIIGAFLGVLSSFLGIGGGPINLVVLAYFFSLETKEAALSSIYIIMFSQITSIGQAFLTGSVPDVNILYVIFMVCGGVAGGMVGSKINKNISTKKVDKLFMFLMIVIIGINIYNAYVFWG